MPGKFEGEPDYTEYYYNVSMDGGQDEIFIIDDMQVDIFRVNAEDIENHPDLAGESFVILTEDNEGFVSTEVAKNHPDLWDTLITMGAQSDDVNSLTI